MGVFLALLTNLYEVALLPDIEMRATGLCSIG